MEDHHHHHHHHQYSNYMADPRLYVNRPLYAPVSPPSDLSPYTNMLVFRSADDSCNNNNNMMSVANTTSTAGGASSSVVGGGGEGFSGGFEMEVGGGVGGGGGRWPRQETLTLLEIRSRLDAKFKEANQKGPLWEEVSRIMSEEHGYQRSGKKCREKFENLYKYYKKTKEGKAGRQDGKHYRFFRQLEALYGDSNTISETNLIGGNHFHYNSPNMNMMITSLANNDQELNPVNSKMSDTSLSLSNFSDSHTTSSDESDHNEGLVIKKKNKRSLKVKIKDFIDQQMKKLTDKQEEWMEKMMRTIEHKEQERMLREEEWRKQDAERIEMEHKFWASERAWIESRDASLMDTFQKLSGKVLTRASSRHPDHQELMARSLSENGSDQTMNNNNSPAKGEMWPECEILKLIQLKTEMDLRVQQCGISSMSEEMFWDGISRKMACFFGHDRSGLMCKEKWESVNNYALKCHNKKRKENHESIYSQGGGAYSHEQGVDHTIRLNIDHHGNSNAGNNNGLSESCFRYFMGDDYGRIMD